MKSASIVPTPPRGRIPLYFGGFNEKAMERTAKYGDGYFGNMEWSICTSKSFAPAARIQRVRASESKGCLYVVARDPDKAIDELAPSFTT